MPKIPASRHLLLLVLLSLLVGPIGLGEDANRPSRTELLKLGDTYLEEKTFKEALGAYRRFLASFPDAPERFEVHERIARAMMGLRQFRKAFEHLEEVLPETPADSLDRARIAGLLGQAMTSREGGSRRGLAHLDTAIAHFRAAGPANPALTRELKRYLLVRARALVTSWDYGLDYEAWRKEHMDLPDITVNEVEAWEKYSRAERLLQDAWRKEQVEATYADLIALDGGSGHEAAQARFLLGAFRINAGGRWRSRPEYFPGEPEDEIPEAVTRAMNDYVRWVEKGIAAWTSLLEKNSHDDLADDASFLIAHTVHHRLNDFPRAVEAYEAFLASSPFSPWASDARRYLQDIRKEDILLTVPGAFPPGKRPEIGLLARNVEKLAMTVYRLDLPAVMKAQKGIGNAEIDRLDLGGLTPLHRFTVQTGAGGDHTGYEKVIEIPVETSGAYLVHADGDTRTARAIVIVSRLALIQKLAGTRDLYLVVDAGTGEPVAGAGVTILAKARRGRQTYERTIEGVTGKDGLYEPDMTAIRSERTGWNLTAIAGSGDDVAPSHGWFNRSRSRRTFRVFTSTDRPVYRPGQTVHFKVVARSLVDGEHVNLPGKAVTVKITDSRRNELYSKTLVTNAHGSVSGDLALEEEPPLGAYHIRVFIDGRQYHTYGWSGAMFRVEEYKKPEYEVTVETSAPRVKPGQDVEATIAARYYFGAPVANADVAFTVHRIPYRHVILPDVKYRWYHDLEGRYGRRSWDWRRELVLEGKGRTDDEGRLVLSFASKSYDDGRDSKYVIEAKVVDKSRREIRGQGSLFATEKPFFVSLEPERRIYRPGDRAKARIRAVTANEKPVASRGEFVISIRRDGEPDEEGRPTVVWDQVAKLAASTNEAGEGRIEFVPDRLGAYRFEYVTKGSDGVEVRGETGFWVVSEEFRGGTYRFQNVQLVADQRTYRAGERVTLLVNTEFADVPVLLTTEADGRILSRRIVRTQGHSMVLELPVDRGWMPNLFVKALFVRSGRVYQDTLEILVPPEDRFLDVTITGAKPTYLPGEDATFVVHVKDAAGEPVATELAVSVFDRSILYIQPDLLPDLRQFFYGRKRGNRVRLATSFDWRYRGRDVLDPGREWKQYKTHRMPDSLRPWRYDFVSPGFSYSRKNRRAQGAWGDERLRRSRRGGGGPPPARSAFDEDQPQFGTAREGEELAETGDLGVAGKLEKKQGGTGVEPVLRSFFADSCYWNAHLVTGEDGRAEVKLTFPDSLTTWRAIARAISDDTTVGSGTLEPVVRKNVLVRLAAPRFFTERDEVVLSGIVRNDLPEEKAVRIALTLEGGTLELMPEGELSVPEQTIRIASGKEQRVDWRCRVLREGRARVTISAVTDVESDAMRLEFPVLPHAVEKFEGRSGAFVKAGGLHEGEGTQTVRFDFPEAMDPSASRLEVELSPSLASMLLEPLPYLADYPYGCTEQTLNRFMPSVIVKKTLAELGVDVDTMTVPEVRDVPGGYWGTPRARKLKLLRKGDLDAIVKAGLTRLYDFQHGDGGWGWWKEGRSDDFMTALVLRGLVLAREADVAVDTARLDRCATYLLSEIRTLNLIERKEIGDRIQGDAWAHMAEALLRHGKLDEQQRTDVVRLVDALYALRVDLAAGGRAFLALSLHHLGDARRTGIVLDNMTDHALVDAANGTVRFGRTSGYRTWRDDAVEATSWALQAYLAARPDSTLVPRMMRWLTRNRRGAHWASTRDTASAVLGLAAYLRRTRELDCDVTVTVDVDGSFSRSVRFTRENALTGADRIVLAGERLRPGRHEIVVKKTGRGNVYFAAYTTYLTREDHIEGAGHEIHVERRIYRLVPRTVKVERKVWMVNHWETRMVDVVEHERVALVSGAMLTSGDLIEVELLIKSDNDYRYLVFEDYKAAGCEPVRLRSGGSYGGLWTNMELRDEKIVFFASRLPQTEGDARHAIRYRMRCEVPGRFAAMPVRAWAMYLPEVRAISDEFQLRIEDARPR